RCTSGLFSADRALHWGALDLSCAFASVVHVVAQHWLDAGPEGPLLTGDAQKAVGRGGSSSNWSTMGVPTSFVLRSLDTAWERTGPCSHLASWCAPALMAPRQK